MTLKKYIQLRGLTMTKVCEHTRVNLSMLSQHINGHKKLPKEHCRILANALGMTAGEVENNKVSQETINVRLPFYDNKVTVIL